MKILLLADIHSNWPALEAIEESFDACIFAGDLVDYGLEPVPCIDWIRRHANAVVRGNHDHAVAQRVPARGSSGFRALAAATRPLHWDLLSDEHFQYLAQMPVTNRIRLDGLNILLVHGTPRDPLDEYLTDDAETWRSRLQNVDADIVCVGHTHIPYQLDFGHVRVINPGSVGQPRDGDPRCSYVIIEDGQVEFRRVRYDVERSIDQLRSAGINGEVLDLAASVLRTGEPANKTLDDW